STIFRRSCDAHAVISDVKTGSQLHPIRSIRTIWNVTFRLAPITILFYTIAVPKGSSVPSVLDPRCPSRLVLDRIADKWTALVIQILAGGTMRYAALQREIGGISQKMLTQTL